jgi:hypothetical protein
MIKQTMKHDEMLQKQGAQPIIDNEPHVMQTWQN